MEIKAHRGLSGSRLYWVGLGCLGLTVAAFAGSFSLGNFLDPQGAVVVLVVGLVISVVASITAAILAIAGLVAFPLLRGRFIMLLVVSLLFSPLLWLGLMAVAL
ncbi:hypothetical protein IEE92_06065 [Kocuria sp. cx-116]|uniref:hypothetical protein n=1 Tax=Kocuria sp. cx-116 TaxID=2771378 RepID=UPI0016874A86|nr:hypothetical protein [Kocuria sp. cx-116]MBD2762121.1 hypothetical protein [Kocuria sp. cx-116]